MTTREIIAFLDAEIVSLQHARDLIASGEELHARAREGFSAHFVIKRKRNLSPEARAKIVEAQRKRWARVKEA